MVRTLTFDRLFAFMVWATAAANCCGLRSPGIRQRSGWLNRYRKHFLGYGAGLSDPRQRCCLWRIFTKRLRAMGIRDRPIRRDRHGRCHLSGERRRDLRRECLDHVLIFGERHLRRVLKCIAVLQSLRTHLGLEKDTPLGREIQCFGTVTAMPVLFGLHHRYERVLDFRKGQAAAGALDDPTAESAPG